MPDAVAYPLIGLAAAAIIALALVWPQGVGDVSPAPFGHPLAAVGQPPAASETPLLRATGPGLGRAIAGAPNDARGAAR